LLFVKGGFFFLIEFLEGFVETTLRLLLPDQRAYTLPSPIARPAAVARASLIACSD
jgi:hypothetical protein